MTPDELTSLMDRYVEGTLDAEGCAALSRAMADSPQVRQAFLQQLDLHAALQWQHRGRQATPIASAVILPRRRSIAAVWALAAAVAIAAGVGLSVMYHADEHGRAITSDHANTAPAVALLSDLSEDAKFADSALTPAIGSDLPTGTLTLVSGSAQVLFHSGAVVDMVGPCTFEMSGDNAGFLHHGTLHATVPHRARGFTVRTPDGLRVRDLGTEFIVRVRDANPTLVGVLRGRVDLSRVDHTLGELKAGQIVAATQRGIVQRFRSGTALASATPLMQWNGDTIEAAGGVMDRSGRRITSPIADELTPPSIPLVDGPSIWALSFDGKNRRGMALPNELTPAFTLMMWVRTQQADAPDDKLPFTAPPLIDADMPGPANDFAMTLLHNRVTFHDGSVSGDPNQAATIGQTPVNDGHWHHIAVVRQPGRAVLIYVDGRLDAAGPAGTAPLTDSPTMIVGDNPVDNRHFNGLMSQVAVFDSALDPSDIQLIYQFGAAAVASPTQRQSK